MTPNTCKTSRRALLTLDNGQRVLTEIGGIPTKMLFRPEQAERELLEQINKAFAKAEHKVTRIHLMRN